MPVEEIIKRVEVIAHKHKVEHLDLFGSFANGTAGERSDVDFVVYGCKDILAFEEDIDEIPTLRKIDIFNYDEIANEYLREDIDKYGRKIF
ncbi:MAG: nucleotidyltransferase domain-containing protein [Lachnospiraceae bacterium]|nr:nucleotidyltransferase domain-containing protein [Lachnospiraceae bacterium]